ncbi:hypothetical protein M4D70_18985 [Brevibacillus borstelensis]|uniref:hypothetical protein n=1 Tax=Brevibacillus borstelensis TaxID=45462 RepID=UPI0020419CEB|nr:hypothetical protein [Brevibacillus borstelensis]MCM3624315.1 hypothetical protein [Brevibacillus borstelensis]
MSIRGSEKEFLLSVFLMKHKEVLEKAVGFEIDQIKLEKNHGRHKIDLYGICPLRRLELFVECQVTPSDQKHLHHNIYGILQSVQEGQVIWIASSFRKEHLLSIKSFLRQNHRKYINFYCLEINPVVLNHIENLNSIYRLNVWGLLDQITDIGASPLRLVFKHEQIPPTHIGKANTTKTPAGYNKPEDIKEYVLAHLRQRVPELLNVHKEKKRNQYDRIITIGGGKSGVYYRVCAEDNRNTAFVELMLDGNQVGLYRRLEKYQRNMKEMIHSNIQMKRGRRIGVYFVPDSDLQATVKKISDILSKMVHYFSPFVYKGLGYEKANFKEKTEKPENKNRREDSEIWDLNDSQLREVLFTSPLEPGISDILLKESDNEQAYIAKQESIGELLMHR